MNRYNENEGVPIRAEFLDEYEQPIMPNTAEYNVYCLTTKKLIQDWTPLSPVAVPQTDGSTHYEVTFRVAGPINAIQNDRNARETKEVLIVADRGLDTEWSQPVDYIVLNLSGR